MATAPWRKHTCGESKFALAVGAQKKMRWDRVRILLARLALSKISQSGNRHRNVSDKSHWCGQGAQTKAHLEVEKLMASKPTRVKIKLKSSQAFVKKFFPFLRNLKKEIVKIVLLEPKLQLIKDLTISKGSFNIGIVQPREFMTPTIWEYATSFSLIHNHPNGKPSPSQKYFEVTDRLNQTGKIIGIHIVDHIIIGVHGFFSFADEGLL